MNEARRFQLDLLLRARTLPEAEQEGFLESACDDEGQRLEILRDLRDEDRLRSFGGIFTASEYTGSAGDSEVAEPRPGSERRATVELGDTPGSISRIGPYKVLRQIGSGGMGQVFLAEQHEPIHRRVAIKLMRTSLASRKAVARFSAERQAMARLSHTHVARIIDGGTTGDGHPFLVMEHVPGPPITEYCDRESLSVDERLRLFLEVCAGVQHAHLNQILHRDLKPSNILVTELDGVPVVKIIDFGIAKALDQPLIEEGPVTAEQILGTPLYMSPEALHGTSGGEVRVDARTDVYSIGVVLYELLAGAGPFDLTGGLAEVVRRICEDDPPRLSRRVSTLASNRLYDVAHARRVEPVELSKRLSGDADRILRKALAKDPNERYASAAELAAEVERHLSNEPVLAGPRTLRYRFGKLVRRHRWAAAAAAVALAALLIGITGTTYGLVKARHEADLALRARAEEEQARQEAEQVARFLVELFEVSDPGAARGNEVTARELLDRGAQRIGRELAGQPLVRARMMGTLGRVYDQLGLHDRAEDLLEENLRLRRSAHGDRHPEVAESLASLGHLYRQQGRLDEAETALVEGLVLQEELLGNGSPVLVATLQSLAAVHTDRGEFGRSDELLRRVLALAEAAYGGDSPEVAMVFWNLGNSYKYQGLNKDAEDYLRRALGIQLAALGRDHPDVAQTLSSLALVVSRLGDVERAEQLNRQALAIYERALGPEHPQVNRVLSNLAYLLFRCGRYLEARPLLERAVASDEKNLTYDHPYAASRLTNLGLVYWKLGLHSEAEPLFHRATAIRDRILDPGHPHRATSIWGLANVYRDQGRLAEAETLYRQALAIRENALPPGDAELVDALREYAVLLRRAGRDAEASELESRM